jgi:hypothetical protein
MSFFEQYRMGVPIIAPSQRLMARWHIEYGLVAERTWDMTFRHRRGLRSVLPQHPHSDIPFDPNDDTDEAAVAWWIQWVRAGSGVRGVGACCLQRRFTFGCTPGKLLR